MLPFCRPIFYGSFKLLWNASKDCLGFLDHMDIYFEVPATQFIFQRWKQPKFGKPLSTEWSFQLSIFLFSHKILWCNFVRTKHPFSCLHGDTLSGNRHYFHMVVSHVNEVDTFLLTLLMLPNVKLILSFCPLLLTSLIVWRGTRNCFNKIRRNFRSILCTNVGGCLLES